MSALTTTTRFKAYAGITNSSQDALISVLITEASAAIERYIRRTLTTTSYKMWFDGLGSPVLRLNEYPVTALVQVSVGTRSVATISNPSSTVAFATVSVDGTNIILTEVSILGIETQTTLPVATYKTIGTMLMAINAVTGWNCTVLSADYSILPTSMLRPLYGLDALGNSSADLVVPSSPVPVKILFEDQIEIINSEQFPSWDIFPQSQQPNRMSGVQPGTTPPTFSYGFPPGSKNIFVWFTAGYTMPSDSPASDGTLPAGLALIANQVIQDCLASTKLNSNLRSESIGDYSYSLRATAKGVVMSAIENHKYDLNQYRRVSI